MWPWLSESVLTSWIGCAPTLWQLMSGHPTVHGSTLRAKSREEKAAIVAGAAPFAPLIRPHVHAVVPLAQAAEAHALMDDPDTFGKVVLAVR